ncbi:MAG: hypothetical protein Q7V63_06440 [Gammaproteobacteria bacterium]|nr:hypothetical protein [Gammaproteobacteria bacterium]
MRKVIYLSSIFLGISLLSTMSYADISAQSGYFINVNGGYSGLLTPRAPTNYGATPAETGTYKVTGSTWSVTGGYQWALDSFSTVGLELGYSKDGQSKYTGSGSANDTGSLKLTDNSIDLLATFDTMWASGFNVFLKGGIARQSQKADLDGPLIINGVVRPSDSFTEHAFAPIAEFGLGYMITNNWNIYTSVRGIFGDAPNTWADSTSGNDYNSPAAAYQFRLGMSYLF